MREINRGATEIHTFTLPVNKDQVDKVEVRYVQNGTALIRRLYDLEMLDGSTLTVKLSVRDTMKFMAKSRVKISLRLFLVDGTVTKSNIMTAMTDE